MDSKTITHTINTTSITSMMIMTLQPPIDSSTTMGDNLDLVEEESLFLPQKVRTKVAEDYKVTLILLDQ